MSTPARVRLTIAPATGQLRFSLRPAPKLQFTLRRGGNASAALSADGNFVIITFGTHKVRIPRDDVSP